MRTDINHVIQDIAYVALVVTVLAATLFMSSAFVLFAWNRFI